MYCNHMYSQTSPSTPPQESPTCLPAQFHVLSFFLMINNPQIQSVLTVGMWTSSVLYLAQVAMAIESLWEQQPCQDQKTAFHGTFPILWFLDSFCPLFHEDPGALGAGGSWHRCIIEDSTLNRHLFSEIWPALSLRLNCWPLQRNIGERQRVVLIYVHEHTYVGNCLVTCPFSKTTVVGSPPPHTHTPRAYDPSSQGYWPDLPWQAWGPPVQQAC